MNDRMRHTLRYIQEVLGIHVSLTPVAKSTLDQLPLFIHEIYKLYKTEILNAEIIFAELKNEEAISIQQTEKHVQQIKKILNLKVVVVLQNIAAYNRRRMIEKGMNFIVAGKQLFLPDLFVDLRESYTHPKARRKKEALLPSAQFLLFYHILHRKADWELQEHPFKEIAHKLNYTPMAITNAIDNLKSHSLVEVIGEKEKFIHFRYDRKELWEIANQQDLLVNPVLKTIYVDEMPKNIFLPLANASALPEYTDLNPVRQQYYAMEKNEFYKLQKANTLVNPNDTEGKYALEIWKYAPVTLAGDLQNDLQIVDPLSLYLSLKDSSDERLEMALKQIIDKFIW